MTVRTVASENRVRLNLFGRWLAVKRAEAGLTQKELAVRLGNVKQRERNWERGKLPPGSDILKISRRLRVSCVEAASRHWATKLADLPFKRIILSKDFQEILDRSVEKIGHGWVSAAFGTKIRAWRGKKSQEEAAGLLGLRNDFLSAIETGKEFPDTQTLPSWSEITQISLSELAALWIVDTLVKAHGGSNLDFSQVLKDAAAISETAVAKVQHSSSFGARIREWRGKRTQDEAAEPLLVNRSSLSEVETELKLPGAKALSRWSEVTGIPLSELSARWIVHALVKSSTSNLNFPQAFLDAAAISKTEIAKEHPSNSFGARIKKWRAEKTQEKAAGLLGISVHFLFAVETGKKLPGMEALSRWSGVTGIPLSELLARRILTILVQSQSSSNLNFPQVLESAAAISKTQITNVQSSSSFGARIRVWRGERTQREAANILGISHGFLSAVETEQRFPDSGMLSSWSEITQISLSELVARWVVDVLVRSQSSSTLDFPRVLESAAVMSKTEIAKVQRSNSFGTRIAEWRGEKTQDEAAGLLLINRSFMSDVENGHKLPDAKTLSGWSEITGIPLSELAADWVIDQAVKDYWMLDLSLKTVFKVVKSVLEPVVSASLEVESIERLFGSNNSFFLNKLRQIFEEQGISTKDQSAIRKIAIAAGIPLNPFKDFLNGKLSVRYFLSQCQDEDVLPNLSRQIGYAASNLIGYLGIDLALAYEALEHREAISVARLSRNGEATGYDLDSFDPTTRRRRLIEVKASSTVTPFHVWTPVEFETAQLAGPQAYLLTVFNASLPDPTIIEIQNPTAQLESRLYGNERLVYFRTIRNLVESRGYSLDPLLPGIIKIPYED